jgi:hypothetical protein
MEKDYIPGAAYREVRNQFVSIYRLDESIERRSNAVDGGFRVATGAHELTVWRLWASMPR